MSTLSYKAISFGGKSTGGAMKLGTENLCLERSVHPVSTDASGHFSGFSSPCDSSFK